MNTVAQDIVTSIILYIKMFKDMTPSKFWLVACKAAVVQSTQLCNAREYNDAIKLIENISGKVTTMVNEHFLPVQKPDDEKVMQDSYYTFAYRKQVAQHLVHYMDYSGALRQLKNLLQDELSFYGMKVEEVAPAAPAEEEKKENESAQAEEEKKDAKDEDDDLPTPPKDEIDLSKIKLDFGNLELPEHQYSRKSHPVNKILDTLLLIAECYTFKMRQTHSVAIYDFVLAALEQLYGTKDTVQYSYALNQKAECYFRQANDRILQPIEDGLSTVKESVEIIEKLIGYVKGEKEVNNMIYTYRLQTLADGYRDAERHGEAEVVYRRVQTMVGNMFGEDHPAMLPHNGNIITCLSYAMNKDKSKSEEEKK
jgi:hypothetical protein